MVSVKSQRSFEELRLDRLSELNVLDLKRSKLPLSGASDPWSSSFPISAQGVGGPNRYAKVRC
jgi:hypothetical protein